MNALAILPETGQVPKWKVINIEPDHVEVQLPDTNLIMSVSKTQLLFPAKVVPGMSIDLMVIPDGLSEKAVAYKWLAGLECIAGTIATVQRDHSRRSDLCAQPDAVPVHLGLDASIRAGDCPCARQKKASPVTTGRKHQLQADEVPNSCD